MNSTKQHWDNYYDNCALTKNASPFSIWVAETYLHKGMSAIDFGCGNGRDTAYLATKLNSIIGIDGSKTAIIKNKRELDPSIVFMLEDINLMSHRELLPRADENLVFYSRFFLHAITDNSQSRLFNVINKISKPNDLVAHEFRTPRDLISTFGAKISKNERLFGHYRRFIEPLSVIKALEDDWEILYQKESESFAVMGEDKPVVCRIIARKR